MSDKLINVPVMLRLENVFIQLLKNCPQMFAPSFT